SWRWTTEISFMGSLSYARAEIVVGAGKKGPGLRQLGEGSGPPAPLGLAHHAHLQGALRQVQDHPVQEVAGGAHLPTECRPAPEPGLVAGSALTLSCRGWRASLPES